MMNKLDVEVRRILQKIQEVEKQAREAVKRKDRTTALSWLKKKKRLDLELGMKDKQFQHLGGMLEQLTNTKQTREIIGLFK